MKFFERVTYHQVISSKIRAKHRSFSNRIFLLEKCNTQRALNPSNLLARRITVFLTHEINIVYFIEKYHSQYCSDPYF